LYRVKLDWYFRCDFFPFEFSSVKSFGNQIAVEYLRTQVCTAPMLSKSEKILMSLNSKQLKATLPTGNRRTLLQRDRETAKNDKCAFETDALY